MTIISLLLLAALLPNLTFSAHVNVGIVNGKEAKPHSRPYMVSLQHNGQHFCGGFLISDEFVLTAGHCFIDRAVTVVVGAHDLRRTNAKVGVKSYYRHPFYSDKPYIRNDIMLLRLEKKVKKSKKVNWISISKKTDDKWISILENTTDTEAGIACSVAGWGLLKTKGKVSTRLMEARVKVLSDRTCESKWRQHYVASMMICQIGHGGTCQGDSGGPLVCGKTAVGITSFGSAERCNNPKLPNVSTKISSYIPWIRLIVGKTE
ncbi:granzyme M-like isoform X2 [Myxocyprinus asiaticus]|nr:granzyme M-like isoform X2 [Myxocyprinus asiaticus]